MYSSNWAHATAVIPVPAAQSELYDTPSSHTPVSGIEDVKTFALAIMDQSPKVIQFGWLPGAHNKHGVALRLYDDPGSNMPGAHITCVM